MHFSQSVVNCAFQVTIADIDTPGVASADRQGMSTTTVTVRIFDMTGALADRPFNLTANC